MMGEQKAIRGIPVQRSFSKPATARGGPVYAASSLRATRPSLFASLGLLLPIVFVVFLGIPNELNAHPHIFYDIGVTVHFGTGGECRVEYVLWPDEITSYSMILDGEEVEDEELPEIRDIWRGWFKKFKFYVRIRSNDAPVELKAVEGFELKTLPGTRTRFVIRYTAVVELPECPVGDHSLEVDLADPTYYAAFTLKPKKCGSMPASDRIEVRKIETLSSNRGIRIEYGVGEEKKAPVPESKASPESKAPPETGLPETPGLVPVTVAPPPRLSLRARFYRILQAGMDRLTGMLRRLSSDFQGGLFFTFLGFALAYGMFHALGPGHGKALVAAFLVRANTRPFHALILSLFVTATHTGSAILLAGGVQLARTSMAKHEFKEAGQAWIGMGSGFMVLAIGMFPVVVFAVRAVSQARKLGSIGKGIRAVLQTPVQEEAAEEERITMARIGRWGVAAGLVPCPASIVIMLISINAGAFWIGLAAVIALAVGLSAVLFVIGLAVIYSRQGLLKWFEGSRWAGRLQAVFGAGGVLLVMGLGLLLIGFYWYRLQVIGAV